MSNVVEARLSLFLACPQTKQNVHVGRDEHICFGSGSVLFVFTTLAARLTTTWWIAMTFMVPRGWTKQSFLQYSLPMNSRIETDEPIRCFSSLDFHPKRFIQLHFSSFTHSHHIYTVHILYKLHLHHYTSVTHCRHSRQHLFGVQYLAKGHLGVTGIELPTRRPPPPEPPLPK